MFDIFGEDGLRSIIAEPLHDNFPGNRIHQPGLPVGDVIHSLDDLYRENWSGLFGMLRIQAGNVFSGKILQC